MGRIAKTERPRRLAVVVMLAWAAVELLFAWDAAARMQTLGPEHLERSVGTVYRRCCLPGRRKGCAPYNFGQPGCTSIRQNVFCSLGAIQIMECSSATCDMASMEEKCEFNVRMVPQNRCKPLGYVTTEGCPVDQWQCKIQLMPYTLPEAPVIQTLVCDPVDSSICEHKYSVCE
jgi:hypothetical protein